MKKIFLSLLVLTSLSTTFAKSEIIQLNLQDFCYENDTQIELKILDQGFCEQYLEIEDYRLKPTQGKWKIRLYMSHSFTKYFNTKMNFKTSRYNILVQDFEWAERSSREYFKPQTWKKPGNNPFQMIDEPTNTFVISLEKDGHEFFLSAFHPKFYQAPDQVKPVTGTVDGTPVNAVVSLNQPFDGYNQTAGEIEILRNENTHMQMSFELGYAHRFSLLKNRFINLSYVPAIAFGVMTGKNRSAVTIPDGWWDHDYYEDDFSVQGFGMSVTNRFEVNLKKEYFGFFYENKLSLYRQHHSFLDGTQSYNLALMGNSLGLKIMVPTSKKKKLQL